jgi:hypothetical protein
MLVEVALPLTTVEEDKPGILEPEAELSVATLELDCEEAPVAMVVPAAVTVGPATVRVTGKVQGQLVMTVGPGMTVVAPYTTTVSPPLQVTESG